MACEELTGSALCPGIGTDLGFQTKPRFYHVFQRMKKMARNEVEPTVGAHAIMPAIQSSQIVGQLEPSFALQGLNLLVGNPGLQNARNLRRFLFEEWLQASQ